MLGIFTLWHSTAGGMVSYVCGERRCGSFLVNMGVPSVGLAQGRTWMQCGCGIMVGVGGMAPDIRIWIRLCCSVS
jgi:hypothetical protein